MFFYFRSIKTFHHFFAKAVTSALEFMDKPLPFCPDALPRRAALSALAYLRYRVIRVVNVRHQLCPRVGSSLAVNSWHVVEQVEKVYLVALLN